MFCRCRVLSVIIRLTRIPLNLLVQRGGNGHSKLFSLNTKVYVVKVNVSSPGSNPPTRISQLATNTLENFISSSVVDTANGFAYFGTNTSSGVIIKVRLSDNARIGAVTLFAGENFLTSAVIDTDLNFAYFGTNTENGANGAYVVKINTAPAGFARVGAVTLNDGEDFLTSAVIDTSLKFAYFGTNTQNGANGAYVVKVNVSSGTFARVSAVTLNDGEDFLTSAVIDTTNNFAYFGTNTQNGANGAYVVKVNTSSGTFARVDAVPLNDGEDYLKSAVIDVTNGFAYFGSYTNPGIVVRVKLSTFQRTGAVALGSGTGPLLTGVIDVTNSSAYFGTEIAPARVAKINLGGTIRIISAVTVNKDLNNQGLLKALAAINLYGDWTNSSSGTFDAGTYTVNLLGTNQSIHGRNTFFNLAKTVSIAYSLTFDSGEANQTDVTGTLTLGGGGAGSRLTLKSVDASQWWLNATGTKTVSNVDVQNSHSLTAITAATSSIGSGTNDFWEIIG